jgi:hypothetical protein
MISAQAVRDSTDILARAAATYNSIQIWFSSSASSERRRDRNDFSGSL